MRPPNFGVSPSGFRFAITATTNIPVLVEASSVLPSGAWTPLQILILTNGSGYFVDAGWTNHTARYYRLAFP